MILGDLELKNGIESGTPQDSGSEIEARESDGTIERLRKEGRITWRGYRITYLKRKIFRICDGNNRIFTSYDLWSFFGSSFENALREWGIKVPDIITRGKAARGNFSRWTKQSLKDYNQMELELLVRLAEALRISTIPLELEIQSWHGPGSLAGSWLGKNRIKKYLRGEIPRELYNIATRAYFGGRIDAVGYGFVAPVYHFDIVSAYPSSIRSLPNLTKLHWVQATCSSSASISRIEAVCENLEFGTPFVGRIRWKIPTSEFWGAFPWRSKNGTNRYPLEGTGWYWSPEIQAAIERFPNAEIEIQEIWYPKGFIEYPLKNLITEMFEYRKELKRTGNPAHLSTKLILNSLYGKFAQTVGKAQYYSPIWAGLITSHTRGQLLRVIGDSTVCVMTDSIWSSSPLDIDLASELGSWEQQDEFKLTLAEAGLYEATTKGGDKSLWQRGFDKDYPVDIEELVSQWLYEDPTFEPGYKIHRFVGMGLASVTKLPWKNWIDITRVIHPVPMVGTTKRLPLFPVDERPVKSDFVKLKLKPADESNVLSYPYSKLLTDQDMILQNLEDEITEQ